MIQPIIVLAAIGFCISLYTYWVERKIKTEPTYKPVCDLSDRISCTKPMLSKYANLFYFSNALIGTTYYVAVALLAYLQMTQLLLIITVAAAITTIALAYLLYFKIKAFCILCTSLYTINFLILGLVLYFYR